MAIGLTILGITGIGLVWIYRTLKKDVESRKQEKNLVKFLAEEIRRLRRDVNNLKK